MKFTFLALLIINVFSNGVPHNPKYGLYGIKVAALLRENLINVVGYIMYQPKVDIGSELFTHLHDILTSLKLSFIDVFELIPVLHELDGEDYNVQFKELLKLMEEQLPRHLCHMQCSAKLLSSSRVNLNNILGHFEYNPLLSGILDSKRDVGKLKELAFAIKRKRGHGKNFVGVFGPLDKRLYQLTKEIKNKETQLSPALVGYILGLLPLPMGHIEVLVLIGTLRHYLVSSKCDYVIPRNLKFDESIEMLVQVFNNMLDTVTIPLTMRVSAMSIRDWLANNPMSTNYRMIFNGMYLELDDVTKLFNTICAHQYPVEAVLAARRVKKFAEKILPHIEKNTIKPYMFSTKEEALLDLIFYLEIEVQDGNQEILESINVLKPHLVFHLGLKPISYNLFVFVINAFMAQDLSAAARDHADKIYAFVAQNGKKINDIIINSPPDSCSSVMSCYNKIVRIIERDMEYNLDVKDLYLHECYIKRQSTQLCIDVKETVVDYHTLLQTINPNIYPREAVLLAAQLNSLLNEVGVPVTMDQNNYCTSQEVLLEYLNKLEKMDVTQELIKTVKLLKQHVQIHVNGLEDIDAEIFKNIMKTCLTRDVDQQFALQIDESLKFVTENQKTIDKFLSKLRPPPSCSDLSSCYNDIASYLNKHDVGHTFPPFKMYSPPVKNVHRTLDTSSLIKMVESVQGNDCEELEAAKEYAKSKKDLLDEYLKYVENCKEVLTCFEEAKKALRNEPGLKNNIIQFLLSPKICVGNVCKWIPYEEVGMTILNPVLEYMKDLLEKLKSEVPLHIQFDIDDLTKFLDTASNKQILNYSDIKHYKTDEDKLLAFLSGLEKSTISNANSAANIVDYLKYKKIPNNMKLSDLIGMLNIMEQKCNEKDIRKKLSALQEELQGNEAINDLLSDCRFKCKTLKNCAHGVRTCLNSSTDPVVHKLIGVLDTLYPKPKSNYNYMLVNLKEYGGTTPCVLDLNNKQVIDALKKITKKGRKDNTSMIVNVVDSSNRPIVLKINLDDEQTQMKLKRLAQQTKLDDVIYVPQYGKKCPVGVINVPQTKMPFISTVLMDMNNKKVVDTLKDLDMKDSKRETGLISVDICEDTKVTLDLNDQSVWDKLRELSKMSMVPDIPYLTKQPHTLTIQTKDSFHNDIAVTLNTDDEAVMKKLNELAKLFPNSFDAKDIYFLSDNDNEVVSLDTSNPAIGTVLAEMGKTEAINPKDHSYLVATLSENDKVVPVVLDVGQYDVVQALVNASNHIDIHKPVTIVNLVDKFGKTQDLKLNMDDEYTKKQLVDISKQVLPGTFVPVPQAGKKLVAITVNDDEGGSKAILVDLNDRKVIEALKTLNKTGNSDGSLMYITGEDGQILPVSIDFTDAKVVHILEQLQSKTKITPYNTAAGSAQEQKATVAIEDEYGNNLFITVDLKNESHIQQLKKLSSLGGGSKPTLIYISENGHNVPITIDLDDSKVKNALINTGTVKPIAENNDFLIFTAPDKFGKISANILNVSDDKVLTMLKNLSRNADKDAQIVRVTNNDGQVFKFKLNTEDAATQLILSKLSENKYIPPIIIPQKEGRRPLLVQTVSDSSGKPISIILDTNDDKVMSTLEDLTDHVPHNTNVPTFYIRDGGKNVPIRLDNKNADTAKTLIDLAMKHPVHLDPFTTGANDFQTIFMTDQYGNDVEVTLDMDDEDLVEILKDLDVEGGGDTIYVNDHDGSILPITIDTSDDKVKILLAELGTVRPLNGPEKTPLLVLTAENDDREVIPIFIDLDSDEAMSTLMNLSRTANNGSENIINIEDKFGNVLPIKLDVKDDKTRRILEDLGLKTSKPIKPFLIPQCDTEFPLIALTVHDDGETIPILLDTSNDRVVKRLHAMTREHKNDRHATTIYIKDFDGLSVPIRINTNNRRTVKQLLKLTQLCPEMMSPYATTASPFVTIKMEDLDGNNIEVTIDTSNVRVADILKNLGKKAEDANVQIYIPNPDGSVSSIYLDTTDNLVKRTLPTLGFVKIVKATQENVIVLNLPNENDRKTAIIVNLDRPSVIDALKELEKNINPEKAHLMFATVDDGHGNTVVIKLDVQDEKTQRILRDMSSMTELKKPIQIPMANKRYPLCALMVLDHGQPTPILLDINNKDTRRKLKTMTKLNTYNPYATTIFIGDKKNHIKLRLPLQDQSAVTKLKQLSQLSPNIIHPYTGHVKPILTLAIKDMENRDVEVMLLNTSDSNVINVLKLLSKKVSNEFSVIQVYVPNSDGTITAISLDLSNVDVREALLTLGKIRVPKRDNEPFVVFHLPIHTDRAVEDIPIVLELTDEVVAALKDLGRYCKDDSDNIVVNAQDALGNAVDIKLNTKDYKTQTTLLHLASKTKIDMDPIQIPQIDKHPVLAFRMADDLGNTTSVFLDTDNRVVRDKLNELNAKNQNNPGAKSFYVDDMVRKIDLEQDAQVLLNLSPLCPVLKNPYSTVMSPYISIPLRDVLGNGIVVTLDTRDDSLIDTLKRMPRSTEATTFYVTNGNGTKTPIDIDVTQSSVKLALPPLGRVDMVEEPKISWVIFSLKDDYNGDNLPIILDMDDGRIASALRWQTRSTNFDKRTTVINGETTDHDTIPFLLNLDDKKTVSKLCDLTAMAVIPLKQLIIKTFKGPVLVFTVKQQEKMIPIMLNCNEDTINTLRPLATQGIPSPIQQILYIPTDDHRTVPLQLYMDQRVIDTLIGLTKQCFPIPMPLTSIIGGNKNRYINVPIPEDHDIKIIPLDTKDDHTVNTLKMISISNMRAPAIEFTLDADGTQFLIRIDRTDTEALNAMKEIGARTMLKLAPRYMAPPNGIRNLIPLTVMNINGGTHAVTLNPNNANVMEFLKIFGDLEKNDRQTRYIKTDDSDAPDIFIPIVLNSQRTPILMNMVSALNPIWVCPMRIYPPGASKPLLGFSIRDKFGGTTPFTIDLNDENAVTMLESLTSFVPLSTPVLYIQVRQRDEVIPLRLDISSQETIQTLKLLTQQCLVNIIPVKGKRPFVKLQSETGNLIIDTNQATVMHKLYDLSHVNHDGSPSTCFIFEDDDGFDKPMILELQNPFVSKGMVDLLGPYSVVDVSIIPPGRSASFISLPLVMEGKRVPITLDINDKSTRIAMKNMASENQKIDLGNYRVIKTLLKLSAKCPIYIYPLKIIPARGNKPLITIHLIDQDLTVNLDINSQPILDALHQLSEDYQPADNDRYTIEARDGDGQMTVFNLNLQDPATIQTLTRLSTWCVICIINNSAGMPQLKVVKVDHLQHPQEAIFDLSNEKLIAELERFTAKVAFDPYAHRVEINEPDGTWKVLKLDITDPEFVDMFMPGSPTPHDSSGPYEIQYNTITIPSPNGMIEITLNLDDPHTWDELVNISKSYDGSGQPAVINLEKSNGETLDLQFDIYNQAVVDRLKALHVDMSLA